MISIGGSSLEFFWIIAVSIALGMDAFSCSMAFGLAGIKNNMAIRLTLTVAVFHIFMPLIGLWIGQKLGTLFGNVATGVGALILLWLGGRMLINARKNSCTPTSMPNLKGFGVIALAGSVSLDALSVGFSLGTFVVNIIPATLIMGATAGIMTGIGVLLGRKLGIFLHGKAEALGGIILLIIGIKMGLGLVL